MAGLDEILNGSETTETETEQETVETTEQETTQAEETETEVTTGEQETTASQVAAETETATEPEEVKGLKAAAAAERKKRQELEAEREALRQEAEALRQQLAQRQPQEDEKPFLGEEYEQRFTETESKLKEEVVKTKIMLSREFAMDKYPDYEEKEKAFIEMARVYPALVDAMRSNPNPAGFAYKTVSDHLHMQKLKEIGDPAAYASKLEQELREKIKAEILAEQEAEKKAATEAAIRSKLPKSGFSEERSVGTTRLTTKTFTGPTPLKNILGG